MLTPEQEQNLKTVEPTQVFVDCPGNNCGDPVGISFGHEGYFGNCDPEKCDSCGWRYTPLQQYEMRQEATQLLITEGLI